jgi:hypothetical protein
MVAREDGPWDLFSTLRERAGQSSWLGRGLWCALCIGFWISLPLLLLWQLGLVAQLLIGWLAVAGVGLVIHGVIHASQ